MPSKLAAQVVSVAAASCLLLQAAPAYADGVSFIGLKNNATVTSPVHVEFKVDGLTVKPAGESHVCAPVVLILVMHGGFLAHSRGDCPGNGPLSCPDRRAGAGRWRRNSI